MLDNNWVNPFNSEDKDLISLSTGTFATLDGQTDLMKARDIGKRAYEEFGTERLEPGHMKRFHDPIKTQKLKTFSSMNNKRVVKTKNQSEILKADRNLFAHMMILIAHTRELDMK
ncbi:hypothetical protein DPMN_057721 [Dreissena polymorpha]|uniref:Uncharacterized protein n=1 Tax=Dreissena polymorpha TaxID=45954 RepID=A0A9D4C0S8_DREPO|nr:hypothetical protein DPMN_057721 [Dreissena polymorpha]